MILNKHYLKTIILMLATLLILSTTPPLTATITTQHTPTFELHLNTPNYEFSTTNTQHGPFTTINIEKTGSTTIQGDPQLPVLRYYIDLPYNTEPQITINSITWTSTTLTTLNLPNAIIPVQPPQPKDEPTTTTFVYNHQTYTTTNTLHQLCQFSP